MFIIIAIIMFGLLVAVHEAGHFTAAKLLGVKVNEFSIGMGPCLLKKQKGETLYSLRLLPFGGFCAMEGEDEASDDPRSLQNKALWRKLIIMVAGSFMNFVVGFLIVCLLYVNAGGFYTPTLTAFEKDFPNTEEKYLQVGDRIWSVDGHRVLLSSDITLFLNRGNGETADLVVVRDGKKVVLDDFPMALREYQQNGQTVEKYGFYVGIEKATAMTKLDYAWRTTLSYVRNVWMGLSDLITGRAGVKDLSGPVGIVGIINDAGTSAETTGEGLRNVFYICAFVAVNLAVMNMLPVPALDGGRAFLLLVTWGVEKLLRRKLDPKYENYIHGAGLVILLGLMAFVLFNDVIKLVK